MNEFHIEYNVPTIQPPITERAISHAQALSGVLLSKLGQYATELFTPVILDVNDARNHTNYREQYFADKRAKAASEIAQRFQLV